MKRKVFIAGLVVVCALGACSRRPAAAAVEPIALDASAEPDATVGAADAGTAQDAKVAPDVVVSAPVGGGLWVVDAAGQPVGVLVQRGHAALATGGLPDVLRDGAVVYSPKAGVFFGLQMSTGKVITPRLGVADASCTTPTVAGYYADGNFTSGYGYAFVYNGGWYRVADGQPLQLVACGGTVAEGVDPKCSPHNGSCRGFAVQSFQPPLPVAFSAPLAFAWLAKAP